MSPLFLVVAVVLLLLRPTTAEVPQDGVRCLKGFKSSLSDPHGSLSTWTFPSPPPPSGFLCSFSGVSCWNEGENRLLTLDLPSSGLSGSLPSSLQYCSSLNHLHLPSNSLTGSIPSDLCSSWLPYLVSLDLSLNSLSGPIPSSLSSCHFLNDLLLNGNSLSGLIPPSLSSLSRLHRLSLSDNSLSGAVPSSLSHFGSSAFSSNSHLCGDSQTGLPSCSSSSSLSRSALSVIAAAAVLGALASLFLAFALFRRHRLRRRRYSSAASSDDWPDRLLPHKSSHVSLFHKPIVKIRVADLLAATNGFDDAQAISRARTGAVYLGVLRDGSSLAVKRLPPPPRSAASAGMPEKQFGSEAAILGQLRHPNLVPLLGYCVVEDERLLIYKHLPGGTLRYALRQSPPMDWPTRARIAVGAARGLAWLHHGIQPPLIHGGISSGVILLDDDFESRITEFGLYKLVAGGRGGEPSAFVDGELGEFGYVAPEYSATMIASLKGDIYAFGVVLLEIVTGKKPTEIGEVVDGGAGFKGNLVGWVNWLSGNGRVAEAVDVSILGNGYDEEVMGFVRVALGCVVSRPKDRLPMYKVYQMLKQLGEKHFGHEHYDEFPLLFGKDDAGTR